MPPSNACLYLQPSKFALPYLRGKTLTLSTDSKKNAFHFICGKISHEYITLSALKKLSTTSRCCCNSACACITGGGLGCGGLVGG